MKLWNIIIDHKCLHEKFDFNSGITMFCLNLKIGFILVSQEWKHLVNIIFIFYFVVQLLHVLLYRENSRACKVLMSFVMESLAFIFFTCAPSTMLRNLIFVLRRISINFPFVKSIIWRFQLSRGKLVCNLRCMTR